MVPGLIEESYESIAASLAPIHEAGVVPIVLGGDHAIALPELRAAALRGRAGAMWAPYNPC